MTEPFRRQPYRRIHLNYGWNFMLSELWQTLEFVDGKRACFIRNNSLFLRVTAYHSDAPDAEMHSIFLYSCNIGAKDEEIPLPTYSVSFSEPLQIISFRRCLVNGEKKMYCRIIGYWTKNDLLIVECFSKFSAEVTLFVYDYYRRFYKDPT